jgi:predicted anti-sigma-YlaC factor YlaD
MKCSECCARLELFAGGDLASEQAARIESHLADCASCRRRLEEIRRALDALRAAAVSEEAFPEEGDRYWLEVESKLRERTLETERLSASGRFWSRIPSVIAQAAAVLVIAGLVIGAYFIAHRPAQPPGPGTNVSKGTVEATPPSQGPIVVVAPVAPYHETESFTIPAGTVYSDFKQIRLVRPDELRQYVRQVQRVMPVSTGSEPF